MSGRGFVHVVCMLAVAGTAVAGHSTSIPRANQPLSGAPAALERLAEAYRHKSVAGIDAVLTADYRFHSRDERLVGFTDGSTREDELGTIRSMLEGVTRDGKVIMPKADSVGMSLDGIAEGVDPEHADSTQHYRVLTVTRLEYAVLMVNGIRLTSLPSLHVFHVVRGDAAVLAPGETADSDRWYIRRWLEDITGLRAALREHKGDCGDEPPAPPADPPAALADGPAIPGSLGIRALTNPACAALRVSCDLPGNEPARVEVYDVSGRLVNTRHVAVKTAGTMSVDAGAGTHLLPGVYWVRLGQAARRPSTRMVVVAR